MIWRHLCSLLIPVSLCSALPIGCNGMSHPSDTAMIERFLTHENNFEELLSMFLSDENLQQIMFKHTRPANAIARERLDKYHSLFRKVGLEEGMDGGTYGGFGRKDANKSKVWFHASLLWIVNSGSRKGYVFSEQRPEPLVQDLDAYWHKQKNPRTFTAFRRIKDHWYLYFDFED